MKRVFFFFFSLFASLTGLGSTDESIANPLNIELHLPLTRAITNRVYTAQYQKKAAIAKFRRRPLESLPGWYSSCIMGELGLGPRVLLITEDVIVMEHIIGSHPSAQDFFPQKSAFYDLIAKLKRVHSIPMTDKEAAKETNFNTHIMPAVQFAKAHNWPDSVTVSYHEQLLIEILKEIATYPTTHHRFCHNDFHDGNMLLSEDKKSVFFIDWDFAGNGSIFFDLAGFLAFAAPDGSQDELLLATYFEAPTDTERQLLHLFKGVYLLGAGYWRYQDGYEDQAFPYLERVNRLFPMKN